MGKAAVPFILKNFSTMERMMKKNNRYNLRNCSREGCGSKFKLGDSITPRRGKNGYSMRWFHTKCFEELRI